MEGATSFANFSRPYFDSFWKKKENSSVSSISKMFIQAAAKSIMAASDTALFKIVRREFLDKNGN